MSGSTLRGIRPPKRYYLRLILGSALLLTAATHAAKPDPRPDPEGDSVDLGGGFVENMGFIQAGDEGVAFTNEAFRHLGVSVGQLGGVNPETGDVIINEGNLLPLVAQELDITGFAFFYTNIFVAGDTHVYGTLYGSGAGISNIPVFSIQGSLTERPEIQHAMNTISTNITTLQSMVIEQQQASADTNNPHQVSAEQLDALPCSGGYMSGDIDMSGVARIISLPEPINDQDAVSKSYLEKRLNYIEPQGDIGMGIYTNTPSL